MWALIENGFVVELTDTDPTDRYHPSLVWVKATKTTEVGMGYADGKFTKATPAPGLTMEDAVALRRVSIDGVRDARMAEGMAFAFPDGVEGTVQLRDERDMLNVNAIATSGNALKAIGDTKTVLQFRDAENVTHNLTGDQAIQFGLDVMKWVSAHYAAAWQHKAAVDTLAAGGDVTAVEAYDFTQGWPGQETVAA